MQSKSKSYKQYFGSKRKVYQAAAPGRLDVMGGIADYSGSLVLQMPIRQTTTATLALRTDGRIRVHSESIVNSDGQNEITFSLDQFCDDDPEYVRSRKHLSTIPGGDWASYVIGCFLVLRQEKKVKIEGADVWVDSHVPIGKGVSSSAALEIAVMTTLNEMYGLKLGPTELPILAQKVENLVVGAPCGLMDQLASYLGEKDRLLPILCQPDQIGPPLEIPQDIHFVGIDSGVRHAVGGASYGDVRIAAFMGYSIIAQHEGARLAELLTAKERKDCSKLPFQGYLANITPSLFEMKYRGLLPEKLKRNSFSKLFGVTTDWVTSIDERRSYAVRNCSAHPIYENHRVKFFSLLLRSLNHPNLASAEKQPYLEALGELMYQSHASYSLCGLGNSVTDELVEAVRHAGPEAGVFGAKITGGGSGGTVCVLCQGKKGIATVKTIADENAKKQNREALVFEASGDGACKNGVQSFSV
ncbi:MAG: GHMP kinase [Candidatus Omnitrophota bacterium]|jgi:L-arabinokinase|nr:MAG: GHMP kinase [Candidatus Omnitrophota bacterium]